MKIGTWSFNDIIATAFDKARLAFTAVWLFVIMVISVFANLLVNALINIGVMGWTISLIDIISIAATVLLGFYIALGITASFKAKTKVKSFPALVKPLYVKQLLIIVVGLIAVFVGVLLAIALGQIARIPYAGPVLATILAIPFVAGLAYLVVFGGIALKLSTAALVENPKASVKDVFLELLTITKNSFAKIVFNSFLLLLPSLIIALAAIVVLGIAYVGYVLFAWALTGNYPILALCLQGGFNAIYVLQTLSGLALLALALSYLVNVGLAGFYSIYLDARK